MRTSFSGTERCPALILTAVTVIFAVLSIASPAEAEEVSLSHSLPGYSFRVYGAANGLPEQTVQAIAQTTDRYLWIGTTGGLARFDGTRFVIFDRENTPALRANSIFCLLAAKDGSLWIGTEGSGLIHYQNGVFRAYGERDGLTDLFVRTLAQDSKGAIWIGTNNGLFQILPRSTTPSIHRVDASDGFPAVAVNAIREDSHGRLWFGGSRLGFIDRSKPRFFQLPGDAARNRVKAISETSSGIIWVGTVSGLYRMEPGRERFTAIPDVHGTARGIYMTSDRLFLISIVGQGTVAYRLSAENRLTDRVVLPSDAVLSIFEDAEKNIWLGTETGLIRLSRTPLTIVSLPHANESDFGTIYQDREDTLWMASTRLFCLRKGNPAECRVSPLAGVKVRNVLEDRDASLWFGTDGDGLYHISRGQTSHYTTEVGLVNNFIRALVQGKDGTLWIGTDEGVSHFNGVRFSNYTMKDGLSYQSVRAMIEDRSGDLWVGTELGLSHFHHGAFEKDAAVTALQRDKVWALHQDPEGSLWIGTRSSGLFRYRQGKLTHYGSANGLASDSVYDIEEDASGRFWISGPSGISQLDRHELDRYAGDPGQRLSLSFYSIASDADAIQIFGGMQSAGALTPDGNVWFPSNRGAVRISPERIVAQPASPVTISQVRADGRELATRHRITLAPGDDRLDIEYSAVMLRPQDPIRFRYKMEGLDKTWNGAGRRHNAEYTNIPPGQYLFRVAAYDLSRPGVFSEVSTVIVKGPYFYRTWWFLSLCLVALAALIFAVHRSRVRQLRRQFEAVLAERSRLAREVHDTLLQGCAGISALLEAISSFGEEESSLRKPLLESARLQLRSTINEARDAIWQLRHEQETAQNFVALLNAMSTRLSGELGVPIECHVEGQPFDVNRDLSHELTMVAREAIHNAASHADPSRIELHLLFGKNVLVLAISDDGCGFEPATVASDRLHFGITGMKERISRLGGTFQLNSTRTVGTTIHIRVPQKTVRMQAEAV